MLLFHMGTNGTILLVQTLRTPLKSSGGKGEGYGAPDGIPLNPADQGEWFRHEWKCSSVFVCLASVIRRVLASVTMGV